MPDEIALFTKKPQKNKQYHIRSYIMKKTYQIKTTEIVPIFAAR
jgi:hypothetical protein